MLPGLTKFMLGFAFIVFSGLVYIADTVGISLLAPRKKITVMLMGNHSAGKSSFINW